MSEDRKRETGYLNIAKADPMPERPARPQTGLLGSDWLLQVKIGDQKIVLPIQDSMMIGRTVETDTAGTFAIDLSDFGGYQNGVSRHHAAITRHEGSLYIEDLGSTNGTRINGFQLTARRKYRLRDGDEVEFARLRALIRFVRPDEDD